MGLLTVPRLLVLTCFIVLLAHSSEGGRGGFGRGGGSFGRSGGRSSGSSFGRSRPASTPARSRPAPSAPVYRPPVHTAPVYRAPVHTAPVYRAPVYKPAPAPAPKLTPYQPRPSAPVQHTNERPIGFVNPSGGSHATPGGSRPIGFEPSVNRQNVGGSHATPGGLPANPPPYPGTNPGANPYNGQRPPTYNEAMGGRPVNPPPYQQHANPSHTYPGVSPSPIGGRPNQGVHTYPGVSPSPIGGNPNHGVHSYPGGTPSPIGNPGYPQQKYYPTQGTAPGSYNPTYQRPGYQGNGYQGPGYQGTGYYQPGYQGPGVPGVAPGYYNPTYIHTTHDNSMSNLATGLALYNLGRSSGHHDHGYYGGHYHDHYYDRNVYHDTYTNNYISDNSGRSRPNYNRNNNEYVPPVVSRPVQNSAPPPANCFVVNATATNQTDITTVSLNCSVSLPPVPSTISPLHKALVLSNLGRHHQHYVDYHKSTHATEVVKAPATNTTIKPINSTTSLVFSGLTVAFVQTEPRLLASVKNITLSNSTMPLSNVTTISTPTVPSVLLSNVTVPTNITITTPPANMSMPLLSLQDPKLLLNASVEATTIPSGNSTIDDIPLRII